MMGFYVYVLCKSGKEIETFSTKQKAKEYAFSHNITHYKIKRLLMM